MRKHVIALLNSYIYSSVGVSCNEAVFHKQQFVLNYNVVVMPEIGRVHRRAAVSIWRGDRYISQRTSGIVKGVYALGIHHIHFTCTFLNYISKSLSVCISELNFLLFLKHQSVLRTIREL